MKAMTKNVSILAAILILSTGPMYAQQSDYKVQQDFKAEVEEITERINNAMTVEEVDELKQQLEELKSEYAEYSDILDAALYPQTFDKITSELESSLSNSEASLISMNELNNRIESLQEEIDGYRSEIANMNEDSEALRERLERATANERRLSGLVTQYRQNIEVRDEFVTEFLENLLSRYQAMDSQSQSEIAEVSERLQDDPIGILISIIGEYINQADSESGLEAPDYLRMRAQHAYFVTVWEQIGERLSNAYASDSPVETQQKIANLLAAWQASIDSQLWDALNASFSQNGIDLPQFTDGDSFSNALITFVDNGIEVARRQNEEADFELYQSFNTYWNSVVKGDWAEFLTNGNVLSHEEIAAVDVQLGEWGRHAEIQSNLIFILFLISLAVILGLIVLLVTKKS